jgi:hypothetical protein
MMNATMRYAVAVLIVFGALLSAGECGPCAMGARFENQAKKQFYETGVGILSPATLPH